jgi:hypothetical protein
MKNPTKRQTLVVVATLLTILVNILADVLPLNGQSTAEISNQFDVYFVPAGYVFSIWGLIYLGLLAYSWFQIRPDQADNPRLNSISNLYIGSCLANIIWLILWHFNLFALTLLAMLSLLILLILVFLKLQPGRLVTPAFEKWVVDIPFEIYLGWISVATIANISDVLFYYHWDGLGIDAVTWALIMLTGGALLASIVYLARKNLTIPLVFIWAYIGIGVKFNDIQQLSMSAWVMAILIAFIIFSLDLAKKIKAGSEILPPGSSDKNRS